MRVMCDVIYVVVQELWDMEGRGIVTRKDQMQFDDEEDAKSYLKDKGYRYVYSRWSHPDIYNVTYNIERRLVELYYE